MHFRKWRSGRKGGSEGMKLDSMPAYYFILCIMSPHSYRSGSSTTLSVSLPPQMIGKMGRREGSIARGTS